METEGSICVVIGLKINYRTEEGKDSLSMWRPELVSDEQGWQIMKATQTRNTQVLVLLFLHVVLYTNTEQVFSRRSQKPQSLPGCRTEA